MERTLKLYARQDLSMRKGKLAAQQGHSACAQLLNAMEDHGASRYLNPERSGHFLDFLDNPLLDFNLVDGIEGLRAALTDPQNASQIIDRGLTEFGGVPTLTCAAEGLFPLDPHRFVPTAVNLIQARQWLVFSKEQPLRKDDAAVLAALGCLVQLRDLMVGDRETGLILSLENPALKAWLTDGFGKIGMGIKTDKDLDELQADLTDASVQTNRLVMGKNTLLVIGPAFAEDVATVMGPESDRYTTRLLSLL
ncbi:peptidyl-tRNA hydrolase [Pseudomonas viridiflava]|uniref:peptidyl-tRNA hydrolase n=1 Tax=Pseudomonas viridiflava TaxID=33069 RepID=UPI000F025053|nr:peptidyl-tRNA hydrolase [Pseudomonas viridiflava]